MGAGDSHGMASAHAHASGMGGMRTAGDLVARMQITRGMRLPEAKNYVAGKLGVSVLDLCDSGVMYEVRGQLGLGRFYDSESTYPAEPLAMEAKFRIAELLEVPINCVGRFRTLTGLAG